MCEIELTESTVGREITLNDGVSVEELWTFALGQKLIKGLEAQRLALRHIYKF